jgi:hypothetical protein
MLWGKRPASVETRMCRMRDLILSSLKYENIENHPDGEGPRLGLFREPFGIAWKSCIRGYSSSSHFGPAMNARII